MKYDNIINLPHYNPKKHPRMSVYKRSAQFAPFAALTGYFDIIEEDGRIVCDKCTLMEDTKKIIDDKIKYIEVNLLNVKEVLITYFAPDRYKNGGVYVKRKCLIRKIDLYNRVMITSTDEKICIDDISNIEI